jgi:hypothetical protein
MAKKIEIKISGSGSKLEMISSLKRLINEIEVTSTPNLLEGLHLKMLL